MRVIGNIFQMQVDDVQRSCLQLKDSKLDAIPFHPDCLHVNNIFCHNNLLNLIIVRGLDYYCSLRIKWFILFIIYWFIIG